MFRGPFACMALLLLGSTVTLIFLPLAVILGYPTLLAIALYYFGRWVVGRLADPVGVAAIWAVYLGLVVCLHGILICFDTALAGAPPTPEEKRFGTNLAYVGGALAVAAVISAYALEAGGRHAKPKTADANGPLE